MSKVTFLPTDYQAPSNGGGYMKIQDGENKFRILSSPILGWEDWNEKKPIRYRFSEKPSKSVDPKKPIRHFWAMIVWNYNEESIQILQITQATIRNSIEALCKDEDWGAPYFYDIKIIRKGEGMDTEYTVNPAPHKQLPDEVKQAFLDKPINLDALFSGADPFAQWPEYTQGIFDGKEVCPKGVKSNDKITKEQAQNLIDILSECDESYRNGVLTTIKKPPINCETFYDLPVTLFERFKTAALNHRKVPVDFLNSQQEKVANG